MTAERSRRSTIKIAALILGAAATPGAAVNPGTTAGPTPDDTTVAVLDAAPPVPEPLPENLAGALDRADRFSAAHPDDLSFPWVDRTRGEVILSAVTPTGRALAASFSAGVPMRIEAVRHSRSYLKQILDSAVGTHDQLGVTVWATLPDAANNRVILEVTSLPRPFLTQLAAAYNPSAIALVVAPWPATQPQ
jgi:hypothetical protein